MAVWLESGAGDLGRGGSRLSVTDMRSAHCQSCEFASWATARCGWSATSSSMIMARALSARSLFVVTFMPGVGVRMQLAASTRSPSISTMHARQFPSAR